MKASDSDRIHANRTYQLSQEWPAATHVHARGLQSYHLNKSGNENPYVKRSGELRGALTYRGVVFS
jgi:hypothetical protein